MRLDKNRVVKKGFLRIPRVPEEKIILCPYSKHIFVRPKMVCLLWELEDFAS